MSTLCTTVDCINNLIIVDACTSGGLGSGSHSFDVTFPNGTTSTMNNSLPFNFTFTSQGAHTIYGIIDGDGYTGTATVQCGKGGPGGKGNPCDSIAGISSCVFSLNERYEELKCNNDKKAEEEKIKLDRVIQLLSLAENDCECGMGMIYEYINEINDIANCASCDKDFSVNYGGGGGGGGSSVSGCTDPAALNYEPSATIDDGSCTYSQNCVSTTMPNRAPWFGASQVGTYVPDDNFEAYLEANGMGNGAPNDDSVCTANICPVTYLNVGYQNIANLTGIWDFCNLTTLGCSYNDITSLDITANIPLTSLSCRNNQLTSLDLTQNINLETLDCSFNNIVSTGLDVSQNTNLTYIKCTENLLTTIDVSQNTALDTLACDRNDITSIDVSQNIALTSLVCGHNQLTSLDVNNNTALTALDCRAMSITSLDLSANNALTYLWCEYNPLTSLNVTGTALDTLYCIGTQLTTIDLSVATWPNTSNYIRVRSNSSLTTLNLGADIDLTGLTLIACWCSSSLVIKVGTGDVPGTTGGTGAAIPGGGNLQTRVEYATANFTSTPTIPFGTGLIASIDGTTTFII